MRRIFPLILGATLLGACTDPATTGAVASRSVEASDITASDIKAPASVNQDIATLHAELLAKDYPFMRPGIEPRGSGREVTVLDPASNQIRFFQPGS